MATEPKHPLLSQPSAQIWQPPLEARRPLPEEPVPRPPVNRGDRGDSDQVSWRSHRDR